MVVRWLLLVFVAPSKATADWAEEMFFLIGIHKLIFLKKSVAFFAGEFQVSQEKSMPQSQNGNPTPKKGGKSGHGITKFTHAHEKQDYPWIFGKGTLAVLAGKNQNNASSYQAGILQIELNKRIFHRHLHSNGCTNCQRPYYFCSINFISLSRDLRGLASLIL